MKTSAFVQILISVLFLLVIPTSCEKEIPAVKKRTDNTAEIKKLTIIADNDFDQNEYLKAYKNYLTIIHLSDPKKNRIDYVDALISIALIQQFEGNYLESEATATKVLPQLKYLKKPRFAWETYKIISENYSATNDYDNALIYAKKAYNLHASPRRKANALANIALVYMYQGEYKKAIKIYTQLTTSGYYGNKKKTNSLEDYEVIDYAVMRNNIGISYANLNDSRALAYYQEALKIRLKLNDRQNLPDSYSNLSDYYLSSNPVLAKKYAETAYKHSCVVNTYKQKKYALEALIRTSLGNDIKKYSKIYIDFRDSINKISLTRKIQFANIKYNFTKIKEENLELKIQRAEHKLEMQRQKNRSFISYIALSITIFIFIFLVFYLTLKGEREKNDAVFKNEIRISDKLENDLEKDIHETLSFAKKNNLENASNKEQFLNYLSRIYSKMRSISRENSTIQTNENFEIELKEMIASYTTSNLNIIINGLNTFSWSKIDRVKKIIVFRVLQEIFDQMKTLNNASLASITFKKNKKNIFITYTDNGTKVNGEQEILQKRLQNVENRIETIKGTFNFDANSESGFKISFKFTI
ncbi:Anaphase-promoting complex, cyclosome, subunit 3 [compost metagenome]|jgi:tetratricopeptide (TPR) repeat protein